MQIQEAKASAGFLFAALLMGAAAVGVVPRVAWCAGSPNAAWGGQGATAPTGPQTASDAPTVTASSVPQVLLVPGGPPAMATVRGSNLEAAAAAQAIQKGQPSPEIVVSLKYVPGTGLTRRGVTFTARHGTPPGEYQLQLLADGYTLTVPSSLLKVVVAEQPGTGTPPALAPAPAAAEGRPPAGVQEATPPLAKPSVETLPSQPTPSEATPTKARPYRPPVGMPGVPAPAPAEVKPAAEPAAPSAPPAAAAQEEKPEVPEPPAAAPAPKEAK